MKRPSRWSLLVALIALIAAAVLSVFLVNRDPIFHGKPESVWIKNIGYGPSLRKEQRDEQTRQWKNFGPEGYEVLHRGFEAERSGRLRRDLHRSLSKVLPAEFLRVLPKPPPDVGHRTRIRILQLLSVLKTDERRVLPIALLGLKDESPTVRLTATSLFIGAFDGDGEPFLKTLSPDGKKAVLPSFLSASRDSANTAIACNALTALSYYPEQADTVMPVLKAGLAHASPEVRLCAAAGLNRIDPATARKSDAIGLVISALEGRARVGSRGALAAQAAFHLRHFAREHDRSIPALISALQSPDINVACNAIWSLESGFREHGPTFKAALKQATWRNDGVGHHAHIALVRLLLDEPDESHTENQLR